MKLPLVLGFLCFIAAVNVNPVGGLPNIVLLFADDLGYGDLEVYGHPSSRTPNLNRLASEGMKFMDFYTGNPVCSPSRAALLTGRYNVRSGIWPGVFVPPSAGGLPLSEITIAKALKSRNYATGIVGKWHLGVGGENGTYLPANHGFDFYTGIPYSHDMPDPPRCFPNRGCYPSTKPDPWNDTLSEGEVSPLPFKTPHEVFVEVEPSKHHPDEEIGYQISDDMEFKTYRDLGATAPIPLYLQKEIIQQPVYLPDIPKYYTDSAIQFIHNATKANRPFFLYVPFHETHHPQFSSPQFFNTSARGMFGDALSELDYSIGRIMDVIRKDSKTARNTFVFFTSDNGPSLMRLERGGNAALLKCGKGTTWDGGQRAPGIAWMPGQIEAGRITRELGATLDIFPTVMELAGVKMPTDRTYDGYSMTQWLFGKGPSKRKSFYYFPKNADPKNGWTKSLHAVRQNEWKLHWMTQGSHCPNTYADVDCRGNTAQRLLTTPLLFNLYHDPGERYPLNEGDELYKSISKRLNATFETILKDSTLFAPSQTKPSNPDHQPCCNWGCKPYPSCCKCNKTANVQDVLTFLV